MADGMKQSLPITYSAGSYAFTNDVQVYQFVSSAGSTVSIPFKSTYTFTPVVVPSAAGGVASFVVGTGSVVVNTTAASASGGVLVFGF